MRTRRSIAGLALLALTVLCSSAAASSSAAAGHNGSIVMRVDGSHLGRLSGRQQFHPGRYSSPLVAADFARFGGHMDPGFPHPWLITMRRGVWATNEQPAWGGRYVVQGNVITFVVMFPAAGAGLREKLRWTYSNGFLRFKVVSGVEGGDHAIYLAHPWRRLAG